MLKKLKCKRTFVKGFRDQNESFTISVGAVAPTATTLTWTLFYMLRFPNSTLHALLTQAQFLPYFKKDIPKISIKKFQSHIEY